MKTFTISTILTFVFCLFCCFSFTQAQGVSGVDDDDVFLYWYADDASPNGGQNGNTSSVPDNLVFRAFPNPSTGSMLNISFVNLSEESYVEVYDENGKSVYKNRIGDEKSNTGTHMLNINSYASGLYLIKLVTRNYQMTKKVVIR